MLVDEFVARTGYYPSEEEWREIIREYLRTDEHKNEFCRRWFREFAMRYFLRTGKSFRIKA